MAFIDIDESGYDFVNVTHQCGKIGPNNFDDLTVVQALLDLAYAYHPILAKKKVRIEVTGKPSITTNLAIADFQATILKRPKPQGYINRATGKIQKKSFSTIWHLNLVADQIIAASGQSLSLKQYLKAAYPNLAPFLSGNGNSSQDEPNKPDEPSNRPQRQRSIDW
jgi:hypothetical protein